MNETNDIPEVDLSIVTTLYHSAPYLQAFHERASAVAQGITDDYEIIFVNDDSPDDSLNIALELFRQDPRVRVIDLARNYRHHRAMMTGLESARGRWVFKIDCDLEDEPEWLSEFFVLAQNDPRLDVVYGVQAVRRGGWHQRSIGNLFYKIFSWLTETEMPRNPVSAWLMSHRFLKGLTGHRERDVFMAGLLAETGFRKKAVLVTKKAKKTTTYTTRKRLHLLVTAVTSFSDKPLVLTCYLGISMLAVSLIAAAGIIAYQLVVGVQNWMLPSLLVTVWLVGGLITTCLGVLGIYVSKVLAEVKQRPYTIIRQSYKHETHDAARLPRARNAVRHTSNRRVIIFGTASLGRLACHFIREEQTAEIVAFAVHRAFMGAEREVLGLDVLEFEAMTERFPPDQHSVLVAVGSSNGNRGRAVISEAVVDAGYELASFVSDRARAAPTASVAAGSLVMPSATIMPDSALGKGGIVWPGAYIGWSSRVGDWCYLAPNSTICGDSRVGDRCFIGAGAIVRNGLSIMSDCVIGMGVAVRHELPCGSLLKAPRPTVGSLPLCNGADEFQRSKPSKSR